MHKHCAQRKRRVLKILTFSHRLVFSDEFKSIYIQCIFFFFSNLRRYDQIPVGSGLEFQFGSYPVEVATLAGAPDAVKLFAWIKPQPGTLQSEAKSLKALFSHGLRRTDRSSTLCEKGTAILLQGQLNNKKIVSKCRGFISRV